MREMKIDFRLPFDVWFLHEHNQVCGRVCVSELHSTAL